MWSSRRTALALLGGALALGLSACSGLTPVYDQPRLASGALHVQYGVPGNRVEQLIYQDLALRIPRGGVGDPKLTVSASQSGASLTHDIASPPQSQKQMTVSATITLTDTDGKVLFSGRRSATADYTTDAQILANRAAAEDAAARAAHLLAETIRLTVLGALGK